MRTVLFYSYLGRRTAPRCGHSRWGSSGGWSDQSAPGGSGSASGPGSCHKRSGWSQCLDISGQPLAITQVKAASVRKILLDCDTGPHSGPGHSEVWSQLTAPAPRQGASVRFRGSEVVGGSGLGASSLVRPRSRDDDDGRQQVSLIIPVMRTQRRHIFMTTSAPILMVTIPP